MATYSTEDFDEEAYKQANPDVAAAIAAGEFTSGRQHHEMYGRAEQRNLRLPPVIVAMPLEPSPQVANPFVGFEQRFPSKQTAVDVFKGRWASDLSPVLGVTGTGSVNLFENDPRPQQAAKALGDGNTFIGMKLLELGPLEAGHTYQLEQLGAASITAVEASIEAFLKCLIVKEVLGLKRVSFLLGDILEYLTADPGSFDLVFCSGILYHMSDPLLLIRAISRITNRCFVWTHYYDPHNSPHEYHCLDHSLEGFKAKYWVHTYGDRSKGFWGGNKATAAWLEPEDLLGAFRHFGLSEISVIHEDKEFKNGSNITFAARRLGE